MTAKTILASALAAALGESSTAIADNLTVNQGDSQTISANATYDAVVVNGNLTVAPNVTLNCTSLTVANDISGTATLTVGDGATVSISGSSKTKIGVGKGRAEVYLGTGATLDAHSGNLFFCYGYESTPASGTRMTEALLVAGPNSTIYTGVDFFFGWGSNSNGYYPSGTSKSDIKAEIRLDKGAKLSTQRIRIRSAVSEKILFNGGQLVQRSSSYNNAYIYMDWDSKNTNLHLEGTNGCPIQMYLPTRGSLSALTTFGSSSCNIIMSGDGGFVKTGAGVFPLADMNSSWDSSVPNIRFLFTGDFVIRDGGFSVANATPKGPTFLAVSNYASRPVDLVVENGASFDLAGCDIGLNSITATGTGFVTNSAAGTATATIGARNDGRGSTLSRVFPGIAFVKQGGASLTLCGSEIDSLDIRGGTLVVKDRATMGYPLYRFKFDRSGMDDNSSINNTMRVREIAYLSNGQDMTRPYSKAHYDMSGTSWITNPERLFDGNLDTVYEDYRMHKAIDDSDRDKVQISLEYTGCKVFDEYRLAPLYSSEFQWQLNPTAWRVFGGFSPDGGDLLDQVTGYSVVEVDGWTSTNFVLSCPVPPTLHVGTLSLANGSKVEATGAQVTCDTFSGSATGVKLDLLSGATLPLTANQSVSEITVDLTKDLATVAVLNPEANGTLNVTGDRQSVKSALLYADSCQNASRLSSWTVYLNGTRLDNGLCYDDGAVRLLPLATVLYMR